MRIQKYVSRFLLVSTSTMERKMNNKIYFSKETIKVLPHATEYKFCFWYSGIIIFKILILKKCVEIFWF